MSTGEPDEAVHLERKSIVQHTFLLFSNFMNSQNIVEFFARDKFDGFNDRLVFFRCNVGNS
jgi:hypothetical protein